MNNYPVDVVIIGGGIAGLFTLAKLINNGYRAVLLEKHALGSGQTLKSQGIIHGGTKYALLGKATEAQRRIAHMPAYWHQCLAGQGDVDLSACHVLTNKQCMWAMPNLSSRVTGFFAGKLMKSRVDTLLATEKPQALQHAECRGHFYALDEPVLDTHSLISTFAAQYGKFMLTHCEITVNNNLVIAKRGGKTWQFCAEKVCITAGQGNAQFAQQQLRPLRMVIARVPKVFGHLYVHVLAGSDKPRLTVSSYSSDNSNELIWYLGGNVAEKGAKLSADATVSLAKNELNTIFPWLDFSAVVFDSLPINRAEGLTDGKRPDTPTIIEKGRQLIAWPTKLAMAPMLADALLATLSSPHQRSGQLPIFPTPNCGVYPWNIPNE